MLTQQLKVVIGMVLAVTATYTLWQLRAELPTLDAAKDDSTGERLALWFRTLLIPAFCMVIGIGSVAALRFFSSTAIDGSRAPNSQAIEILLRYNQNTLEQSLLAAVAWGGIALSAPTSFTYLVPLMACLFGVARLSFLAGYLISPPLRAFGFALTFYPTLVALIWLAFRVPNSPM